jgi:hypothetical protein
MALSREETSSLCLHSQNPLFVDGKGYLEFVHEDCNREEFVVRLHIVGSRISINLKIVVSFPLMNGVGKLAFAVP